MYSNMMIYLRCSQSTVPDVREISIIEGLFSLYGIKHNMSVCTVPYFKIITSMMKITADFMFMHKYSIVYLLGTIQKDKMVFKN